MIALTITQPRGPGVTRSITVSVETVPQVGDWVEFASGVGLAGRVARVNWYYSARPDAPNLLESATIELDGWKHGFKKD